MAKAELVKFGFRPGTTYEYELTSSSSSNADSLGTKFSGDGAKSTVKFQLKIIDIQDGAYIVDIKSNEQTYRRYIKENGEITGAPGEAGKQIPFFLTFPQSDWQVGQKHQTSKSLSLGKLNVPANWNMLLKSIDSEKEVAEIWFAANVKLPEDRLRKKDLSLKGKLFFDLAQGIINQAEWATEYSFAFINKEIAVTRNLWQFQEKSVYNLKLLDIKE